MIRIDEHDKLQVRPVPDRSLNPQTSQRHGDLGCWRRRPAELVRYASREIYFPAARTEQLPKLAAWRQLSSLRPDRHSYGSAVASPGKTLEARPCESNA
jgi:hypothetical protein